MLGAKAQTISQLVTRQRSELLIQPEQNILSFLGQNSSDFSFEWKSDMARNSFAASVGWIGYCTRAVRGDQPSVTSCLAESSHAFFCLPSAAPSVARWSIKSQSLRYPMPS